MNRGFKGFSIETEEHDYVQVTRARIASARAAAKTGKPIGEYITLQSCFLRFRYEAAHRSIAEIAAEEISRFVPADKNARVLVVGLGNGDVETDSLGVRVAKKILVTNHLPAEKNAQGGVRPVCAFAPGVTERNGIETADVVRAVCREAEPAFVIVVDALAAEDVERLNTTIQISDAPIAPGKGLGDKGRKPLGKSFLGVPVLSVGAPSVISVQSLAAEDLSGVYGFTSVAPCESGVLMSFLAEVISNAINLAINRDLLNTMNELQTDLPYTSRRT